MVLVIANSRRGSQIRTRNRRSRRPNHLRSTHATHSCASLGEVLVHKKVQMKLRGANRGALRLTMKLASSHKALNGISAKLALTLEVNGTQEILTSHLPGRLNVKACTLSRVSSPKGPKSGPEQFRHIKERKLLSATTNSSQHGTSR